MNGSGFLPRLYVRDWRSTLLRFAIVLIGALAITLVSLNIERVLPMMQYVLGAGVAAAAGALALKYGTFPRGIVLVVLTATMLNFFDLPTGRDSRLVISLVISLGLLLFWAVQLIAGYSRGARPQASPINVPTLLFVLVNLVSYPWSILMRDPGLVIWNSFPVVQAAALLVNIALPLMMLFAMNKMGDARWLRLLVWLVIGVGAYVLVVNVTGLPLYFTSFRGTRGLFPMWFAALAYGLALFDKRLSNVQRLLLLALVAGEVYWRFGRNISWVSGWLPLGVACAVITWLRSKRAFAAVAILAAGVLLLRVDYWNNIIAAERAGGSDERWALWEKNLTHVANHPVFGVGPAGYAIYNVTYHPRDARSTHNNYMDVLSQNGVAGMAAFVFMMAAIGRLIRKLWGRVRSQGDFVTAYAAAMCGGFVGLLIGMFLGDWVLPFAYNQTITGFDNAVLTWLFLGFAAALYARVSSSTDITPTNR
jgi:O-antigen ligase